MKMKNYYMPTLRDDPSEAEIASHKFLLRGGMIRKTASGIYSYLPLGLRVIHKIENIVRKKMDKYGAQEVLMSAIQPQEIWEESGRWQNFGPEMFKLKDRNDRNFCLGPTAEEYFTMLVRDELKSYKQLPLNIYQIQTKYRDEKRPRFGINRAREFTMKDAYTFDKDVEAMKIAYKNMWDAYVEVFDEIGLDYRVVQGDSGVMGGNESHEFIAMAETGEGVIVYSKDTDFAATDEKAPVILDKHPAEELKEIEEVHTPDQKTIEQVSSFLKVKPEKLAKVVALRAKDQAVFVVVPGHRELNMAKLLPVLGVAEHEIEMLDDESIERITGAKTGFTGPIGLKDVTLIVDSRIVETPNLVCGANKTDFHMMNVNYGRDFEGQVVEDLLMIEEGDKGPQGEDLSFARGIEVGNIFQLGTKYSKTMDATFLDENGKEQYFVMGSYGIGITRTVTAVIEQNYDDKGIIWPTSVAPYHAIITIINTNDKDQMEAAEKLYKDLWAMGIETMLDDRKERPGVKFNDRDLIGIPYRITIGKGIKDGLVEFSTRREMKNEDIPLDQVSKKIII
ncbi:MAG: proline--tRNA ligase [Tissierellia bacterium]|nr:proline--tRNA ligase [Tissierellia bacterium]